LLENFYASFFIFDKKTAKNGIFDHAALFFETKMFCMNSSQVFCRAKKIGLCFFWLMSTSSKFYA